MFQALGAGLRALGNLAPVPECHAQVVLPSSMGPRSGPKAAMSRAFGARQCGKVPGSSQTRHDNSRIELSPSSPVHPGRFRSARSTRPRTAGLSVDSGVCINNAPPPSPAVGGVRPVTKPRGVDDRRMSRRPGVAVGRYLPSRVPVRPCSTPAPSQKAPSTTVPQQYARRLHRIAWPSS